MTKPESYDELYPGRFLKAGLFKGKQVPLTITDVFTEGLASADDDDKNGDSDPPSVILAFKETKMQLVIPKTNAFCLMSMFGKKLADWVGKRIVLFPTTTKMMGKTVDCIRVWGSPHIAADMPLLIPQGLKKPLKMTMHATGTKAAAKVEQAQDVDPAVSQAWSALGYSREAGTADMNAYTGTDYLAHLGALIDQQNAGNA
jgi:hypothetical protein